MLILRQLLINYNKKILTQLLLKIEKVVNNIYYFIIFITNVSKTISTHDPKTLVKDIKPKNNEYYIIKV